MTFYGNVRCELLNGFTTLCIQEQVWGLNALGKPRLNPDVFNVSGTRLSLLHEKKSENSENFLTITSYLADYEKSYFDYMAEATGYQVPAPNSGNVGIIEPSGGIITLDTLNSAAAIMLSHNINNEYTQLSEKIGGYIIKYNLTTQVKVPFKDYSVPIEEYYISSKVDTNYKQSYFIESTNLSGDKITSNLDFYMLNFTEDSFIDSQGHCGIITPINNKYIPYVRHQKGVITEITNNYRHDAWVDALAGPMTGSNKIIKIFNKTQELKSINTTVLKDNEDHFYTMPENYIDENGIQQQRNIYMTTLSNCQDLYTNIGLFHTLFHDPVTGTTTVDGKKFLDTIKKDVKDVKELIDGKIISVKNYLDVTKDTDSLYLYNMGHGIGTENNFVIAQEDYLSINISTDNFIKSKILEPYLPEVIKSINYLNNYKCNRNNLNISSLFIQKVEDLRENLLLTNNYKNTLIRQYIEEIKDFYNLMTFFFYSTIETEATSENFQNRIFEYQQKQIFQNLELHNENEGIWNINDPLFIKWAKRMSNFYHLIKKQNKIKRGAYGDEFLW